MADDDKGAAGAGGSSGSGGESRRGPSDEGRGAARNILKRFRGRAEEALAQMADENKDLRVERRELREKVKTFEAPGTLVLTGDDAKAYNDYKALGTPADLKKIADEVPGLRTKVTDHERRTGAAEFAKAVNTSLGWNPDTVAAMILDKNLETSLVDGQDKDGKAIKIPHVKLAADKDAKPVKLDDYVKASASYLMPALTAKGGTQSAASTTAAQGAGKTTTSTQFVEQGGASSGTAPGANAGGAASAIPGRRNYQTPGQRATAASGNKQ